MKTIIDRTIKNGAVRIYGKTYRPKEPLLPEHEGLRAHFARYVTNYTPMQFAAFVSLISEVNGSFPGVFCDDGVFRWVFWDEERTNQWNWIYPRISDVAGRPNKRRLRDRLRYDSFLRLREALPDLTFRSFLTEERFRGRRG
jgi:hypothetical protein